MSSVAGSAWGIMSDVADWLNASSATAIAELSFMVAVVVDKIVTIRWCF